MVSEGKAEQSSTVGIIERRKIRREKKAERRKNQAAAMTSAQALEHARAVAIKKELELQKGEKTTRKERSAMMKAMKAGVDAAAHVGLRIKQFAPVPAEMLETAKQQEQSLIHELMDAAKQNALGALSVARQVSQDAVQAVQAVQQGTPQMQIDEKLGAALPPVATDTTFAALPIGERGEPIASAVSTAPAASPAPAVIGRPAEPFNQELADDLCAWIQSGNSLSKWLKMNHRDARIIYRWMRENPSFAQGYALAHADRADTFIEDMVDISEKAESARNMVQLLAYKLQIETRQWISQRMKPEKYGAKVQVEQKGQVVFQMNMPKRGKQSDIIDIPSTPALLNEKK